MIQFLSWSVVVGFRQNAYLTCLPYDLIMYSKLYHLYLMFHYPTKCMCIEALCIHVQWGMNLQWPGIRTPLTIYSWFTEFLLLISQNVSRRYLKITSIGIPVLRNDDILPFTTLLVHNFEVSCMTGSTLQVFDFKNSTCQWISVLCQTILVLITWVNE